MELSPLFAMFTRLKTFFLDLLFPLHCYGCKKEGAFLCGECKDALHFIPPHCFVCKSLVPARNKIPAGRTCKSCRSRSDIYAFSSACSYSNPMIRDLIHGLKYKRVHATAPLLAELIDYSRIYYGVRIPENAVCIPVPLHTQRKRERGFNQSELIASEFCRKNNIAMNVPVLERIRSTTPQIALPARERMENMKGVFQVARPEAIQNKTIVLIDDVKTTGATLEEVARVLKEAGAKRVWAMTVAC